MENSEASVQRKSVKVNAVLYGVFFGLLLIAMVANLIVLFSFRDAIIASRNNPAETGGEAVGKVFAVGTLVLFYYLLYVGQLCVSSVTIFGVIAGARRIRRYTDGFRVYYIVGLVCYCVLLTAGVTFGVMMPFLIK